MLKLTVLKFKVLEKILKNYRKIENVIFLKEKKILWKPIVTEKQEKYLTNKRNFIKILREIFDFVSFILNYKGNSFLNIKLMFSMFCNRIRVKKSSMTHHMKSRDHFIKLIRD